MKKYIVTILVILLAVSLALNTYSFGYRFIYQKGFIAGTMAVSNAVLAQYKDTGKIKMTIEDKTIVLVPEKI